MNRVVVAALAFSLFVATPASAWEPIHPTRPVWNLPVPYSLHQAGSVDLGGFAATEAEVRRGMDDWARVSCTNLTTNYRGSTARRPGTYEGTSTIGWVESGWRHGGSAIGVTGPSWGGNRLVEADMEMNGVNFTWTTGPGSHNNVNAYSIILHEGGHYYGLGHSTVRGSSMWPSYGGGIISLGPDDEAGICALYPGGGTDCTTTGCPSGQECVSGACEPIMGDGSMCAPCRGPSDCSGGGLCLSYPNGAGYCGRPCSSSADCDGDQCVNTNGGPQCVRYSGNQPSCEGTSTGCRNDSECASDEICSGGSCVPRPATGSALGEACTSDDGCRSSLCLGGICTQSCAWLDTRSCPSGFYCDADSTTSCSEGYCLRGTAGGGQLGASCSNDTDCDSLFCAEGSCSTPCVPGGAAGCEPGYVCKVGRLSCRGACLPGRELGDACEVNDDCISRTCAVRGGESFCTARCDDATPCPDDFECVAAGDQSVCVPERGGLDAACMSDDDCLSGICTTDHGASYCTRACDMPCPAGFECGMTESDQAVCVRRDRGIGQDCASGADCASGMCATAGGANFCTQTCSDDAPCPNGSECVEAGDGQLCQPVATSGGCGCAAAPQPAPFTLLAGLLGVFVLVWRRRRRA